MLAIYLVACMPLGLGIGMSWADWQGTLPQNVDETLTSFANMIYSDENWWVFAPGAVALAIPVYVAINFFG